jgi:hypothetical protein
VKTGFEPVHVPGEAVSVSPTAALPEIVGGVVFLGAAAPIGGAATHGIPVRDRFFACAN